MEISDYSEVRRVTYANGMTFVPICPQCGRFVKADDTIRVNGLDMPVEGTANGTCKKCGRVEMLFEGYYDLEETQ